MHFADIAPVSKYARIANFKRPGVKPGRLLLFFKVHFLTLFSMRTQRKREEQCPSPTIIYIIYYFSSQSLIWAAFS